MPSFWRSDCDCYLFRVKWLVTCGSHAGTSHSSNADRLTRDSKRKQLSFSLFATLLKQAVFTACDNKSDVPSYWFLYYFCFPDPLFLIFTPNCFRKNGVGVFGIKTVFSVVCSRLLSYPNCVPTHAWDLQHRKKVWGKRVDRSLGYPFSHQTGFPMGGNSNPERSTLSYDYEAWTLRAATIVVLVQVVEATTSDCWSF